MVTHTGPRDQDHYQSGHPVEAYLDDAEQLLLLLQSDPALQNIIFNLSNQRDPANASSMGPSFTSSPPSVIDRLRDLIYGFTTLEENNESTSMELAEDDGEGDGEGDEEIEGDNRPPISPPAPTLPSQPSGDPPFLAQVVIIGASASGLGVAKSILSAKPDLMVTIVESSSSVGASFRAWPPSTRFISPSFYSNPFNQMDLNGLSPIDDNGVQAYLTSLKKGEVIDAQHPTGHEYADYLQDFAYTPINKTPGANSLIDFVSFDTTVTSIEPFNLPNDKAAFKLFLNRSSSSGREDIIYARYVIYAGGEYGHPYIPPFARDTSAAVHYSKVDYWGEGAKGDWVIVGGGEAGIDAAVTLYNNIESGVITIVDKGPNGGNNTPEIAEDPSIALTPRTKARLMAALMDKANLKRSINIIYDHSCVDVKESTTTTNFQAVIVENGTLKKTTLESPHPIIMATGFKLATSPNCVLKGLVDWDETGRPVLDPACDMSTKTSGLFVVGPMVQHVAKKSADCNEMNIEMMEEEKKEDEKVIFCFIYKFRSRFALVAGEILSRIVLDYHVENGQLDDEGKAVLSDVSQMMELYKDKGMLITDLSKAVCGELGACATGNSC